MNVYDYGFKDVLIAMLWAETDDTDNPEPLDSNYCLEDLDLHLVEQMEIKYQNFIETALTIFPPDFVVDWEQVGHDFWLTCRGHGAGFWDREELKYLNIGNQLAEVCDNIYVPDLYVENGTIYSHSF